MQGILIICYYLLHVSYISKLATAGEPSGHGLKKGKFEQNEGKTIDRVLQRLQFDRKWMRRAKIHRSYGAVVHQSHNSRRERQT